MRCGRKDSVYEGGRLVSSFSVDMVGVCRVSVCMFRAEIRRVLCMPLFRADDLLSKWWFPRM